MLCYNTNKILITTFKNFVNKQFLFSLFDILRGMVILLMLVDHVRERFFLHMQVADPMIIDETSHALFFTRFMAHFCAPVFIFLTLVNFSWFGSYDALYLQVMWAIGLSMIALALLTYLPHRIIGLIGIAIIVGHNALDFITFAPEEFGYALWTILHDRGYLFAGEAFKIKVSYPTLPWIGVICFGYFIAPIFSSTFDTSRRQRILPCYTIYRSLS